MKIGVVYKVTKESSDGTFKLGELIYLSKDYRLHSINERCWYRKEDWCSPEASDFEFERGSGYMTEEELLEQVLKVFMKNQV